MRAVLSRAKYPLGGIALLAIIALLLVAAGAKYQKFFRDEVWVTLETERAGSQLSRYAPVKLRGVQVGEVDSVRTEGSGAIFSLALEPDMVDKIPANVRAKVVPKTLLGQRYVKLVVPDNPAPQHIQAGDVIGRARSDVAVELRTVFDETLPVLQAVDPLELYSTLNAIATALEGRGEQLGATLAGLEDYLSGLNPSLPTLQRDIELLGPFTRIYADAAPDLLRVLDNTTFTSQTIVDEATTLDTVLREVTATAGIGERFLRATGPALVRSNELARPILDLLALYSPEFPCLIAGLDRLEQRARAALGGKQPGLHITLEVARAPAPYQYPRDLPSGGTPRQRLQQFERLSGYDLEPGPHCYGLPYPPQPFPTPAELNGTDLATTLSSRVGRR